MVGSIHWRYWDVFNETFPKDVKLDMENAIELGNGSHMSLFKEEKSTNPIIESPRKKIKGLKMSITI